MKLRRNAKIDLLRGVPLFSECSQKELGQIAGLADELYQPSGTTLITEGTKGREFFVLVDGSVDVLVGGGLFCSMGSGEFFGEIALLTDTPRTATVVATTPVRVLVVTGQSFQRLCSETPSMQAKVLEALARRLAHDTV